MWSRLQEAVSREVVQPDTVLADTVLADLVPPEIDLPDAAEIERVLAEIFVRPEFAPREESFLVRYLSRALQWLGERLRGIGIEIWGDNSKLVWWLVIGVIGLIAVVLASRILWRVVRWWRGRPRGIGQERVIVAAVAESMPAEAWEETAAAAAAEGRWRDAILALYQVLLLRLDAAGSIRYDPAKTPGDYRREVGRDLVARGILQEFLGLFEPIAFGAQAAGPMVFERLRAATARVSIDG